MKFRYLTDEEKFERELARGIISIYILMILGVALVIGTLAFIHHDAKTFERDCMDQLMYTRQELDSLSAEISGETYQPEETPAEVVTVAEIEERDLVERVVAAEARGESYEGMVAVAQTIKDRGDYWGMTYSEVVTAPNQYAAPYSGEISETVKKAVSDVFDHGARAFEEPTTHFHNLSVSPYWAENKTCRGQRGNHVFYG